MASDTMGLWMYFWTEADWVPPPAPVLVGMRYRFGYRFGWVTGVILLFCILVGGFYGV